MNILGISGAVRQGNHDGAASILSDGKIVAAAEEERFVKIKHAPGLLPENAIRFCLQKAKLKIDQIDLVVFPGKTYQNMQEILRNFFRLRFGHSPQIELIDHHLAHAASAYFLSGFDRSLILTADLSGDSKSTALFYAENGRIKEIKSFPKPNSLGIFYALFTQYLGFRYNNDECKLMALAPCGSPGIDLSWLLKIEDGSYQLDFRYIDPRIKPGQSNPSLQEPIFSKEFLKKIGIPPRQPGEKFKRFYKDLAASAQLKLEEALFSLYQKMESELKCRNLCLAGGIALNAEANSKFLYSDKVERLFVQPVASDAGLALGGGVYHSYQRGEFKPERLNHLYLGPSYTSQSIERYLNRLGISYLRCNKIEERIAQALASGKIVAVFAQEMEYGPRALGNRSILADPRDGKIRQRLNRLIKQRDDFQPFAPAVTAEDVEKFFELPRVEGDLEFMVINLRVKNGVKKVFPGVVHVNDTSRIQVVRRESAPRLYRILKLFEEYAGIPVLLNTSLNLNSQPIALSPQDALGVFAVTPIDCLALENFWVQKK